MGLDRKRKHKAQAFENNMHKKLEGKEVPKTLRSKKENEMPVSPLTLGLLLFVVIGAGIFQSLMSSGDSSVIS
eukprot:CAMPEP_0176385908 /NCGR_PEP_ID=MMETSP0126-20121128/35516_1 /TAXON_ID=141414 ORGANISM="Strombidinopsis acuminatum, Strain SPMC142" /NCGR_SAMPLE_ID=MMETSP0126 /ASSEMBLY_ACC=CAM_ASM_000229 /LENGTH=72 /DNA_ID=CAMNT_0017752531 /DNA_START=47 /DNA_END=265 /DNA_ORIENTATION=-